jgi:hypothetical protein
VIILVAGGETCDTGRLASRPVGYRSPPGAKSAAKTARPIVPAKSAAGPAMTRTGTPPKRDRQDLSGRRSSTGSSGALFPVPARVRKSAPAAMAGREPGGEVPVGDEQHRGAQAARMAWIAATPGTMERLTPLCGCVRQSGQGRPL